MRVVGSGFMQRVPLLLHVDCLETVYQVGANTHLSSATSARHCVMVLADVGRARAAVRNVTGHPNKVGFGANGFLEGLGGVGC